LHLCPTLGLARIPNIRARAQTLHEGSRAYLVGTGVKSAFRTSEIWVLTRFPPVGRVFFFCRENRGLFSRTQGKTTKPNKKKSQNRGKKQYLNLRYLGFGRVCYPLYPLGMIDTYIHTYVHTYIRTYIHTHTHTNTHLPLICDYENQA
jgi:hypothetical protein